MGQGAREERGSWSTEGGCLKAGGVTQEAEEGSRVGRANRGWKQEASPGDWRVEGGDRGEVGLRVVRGNDHDGGTCRLHTVREKGDSDDEVVFRVVTRGSGWVKGLEPGVVRKRSLTWRAGCG
eukprot:170211-Rhodomonas_salina.1